MHRSALGKCYLPKQPGKKGVRLAVGVWFWIIGGSRLEAVRGTFNGPEMCRAFSQPKSERGHGWKAKTHLNMIL